jgi:hypothetical protein
MRMPAAYAYRGHSEFVSEQCQVPAMYPRSWHTAGSCSVPGSSAGRDPDASGVRLQETGQTAEELPQRCSLVGRILGSLDSPTFRCLVNDSDREEACRYDSELAVRGADPVRSGRTDDDLDDVLKRHLAYREDVGTGVLFECEQGSFGGDCVRHDVLRLSDIYMSGATWRKFGVTDGVRTRYLRLHKPALFHSSLSHHGSPTRRGLRSSRRVTGTTSGFPSGLLRSPRTLRWSNRIDIFTRAISARPVLRPRSGCSLPA